MVAELDEAHAQPGVSWLSWALEGDGGGPGWPDTVPVLIELLGMLVPSDEIVWNGVDLGAGRAFVVSNDSHAADAEAARLLLELDDHPMLNAFLSGRPSSLDPVRLSDLISDRDFRRTRTWADLFAPRGLHHQLLVITGGGCEGPVANGWSFNRTSSEFTDAEVALVKSLQPLLATLERAGRWQPVDPEDALPTVLTPRETEIVALLADGLTATAIAHRLRLSPATVRKHLEHVYEKTGTHDRVLLVNHARRIGLLRPVAVSVASAAADAMRAPVPLPPVRDRGGPSW